MRILVTGKNGQVGSALMQLGAVHGFEMYGMSSIELDITNIRNLDAVVYQIKPDLIINAAAYTAVDNAESEKQTAYSINETGPKLLALACKKLNIPLFHISTDYVFDGNHESPYTEEDLVNPVSVYGRSKLMGELAVKNTIHNYIVLRTAWVFSISGSNFVKTMLRVGATRDELSVVGDQIGGPTSAKGIATALLNIAARYESGASVQWGVYHYSGSPYVSWYDFAKEIFANAEAAGLLGHVPQLNKITSSEYPTPVKRPSNSCLSMSKIQSNFQIAPDDWRLALNDVINELATNHSQS